MIGLRCALTSSPQRTTSAARQLREEFAKSLTSRFTTTETDSLYVTATILDPRCKLLPWTSQGESVKEVQDACLLCCVQRVKRDNLNHPYFQSFTVASFSTHATIFINHNFSTCICEWQLFSLLVNALFCTRSRPSPCYNNRY